MAGEVIRFPNPDNYAVALKRIKALLNEGKFEFREHAEEQMAERQIETTDVIHVIKRGRITEHSRPANNWRYILEHTDVDGERRIKVVTEIDGQSLVIVTAAARGEVDKGS